jgi:cell division protein FtsL
MRTILVLFLLIGGASVSLYTIKDKVQQREQQLGAILNEIVMHEDAIKVLQSEWSYLNRPDRIERLARKHLGLTPASLDQRIPIEALPVRAVPTAAQISTAIAPSVAPTVARASITTASGTGTGVSPRVGKVKR